MAPSIPSSILRPAVLFGVLSIHMTWLRFLNQTVPDPYLDEVFHVPQAQAYWAGRWTHWDDKITTPPGLYLWSYAFNTVRRLTAADPQAMVTVEDLRFSNSVLIYVLLVTLYLWIAVTRKPVDGEKILQRELVVVRFPLLVFFSGLYYTDVFSAWTVVVSCVVWESGRRSKGLAKFSFQLVHFVLGLVSLASRQTNIFWVAIFLAGLQVVDTVQVGMKPDELKDPEVSEAGVEGMPKRPLLQLHLVSSSYSENSDTLRRPLLSRFPTCTFDDRANSRSHTCAVATTLPTRFIRSIRAMEWWCGPR